MLYVTLVKNIHTNQMATVHISTIVAVYVAQQMSFQRLCVIRPLDINWVEYCNYVALVISGI